MLRQAVRLNSLSEVAITKLDVLDVLDSVKVCVAYDLEGERFHHMPYHQSVMHKVTPVYEELPGLASRPLGDRLNRTTSLQRRATISPSLQEQVGVPVRLVGVGPGREQYVHFAAWSSMRVCVVGSGGREHALAEALARTADDVIVVTRVIPASLARRRNHRRRSTQICS